jgi:hypothetical protein
LTFDVVGNGDGLNIGNLGFLNYEIWKIFLLQDMLPAQQQSCWQLNNAFQMVSKMACVDHFDFLLL